MPTPNAAPVGDLTDAVARAQRGDRQALEAVLVGIAPLTHRFALRMCRNAHDADDVLQDTLLSVAKHLDAFEGRASLASWVFAIARSACTRRRRGLKNQPPVSDAHLTEAHDAAPSPEARVADHELATVLSDALDGLSDEHREVILLRDVEGLTAPETASVLGISVDAVKSRLHRAREALRAALRPALEPRLERAAGGCPDVVALWSKKLEGDLSQVDCSEMEKHIETCAACGVACDALKRALVACQRIRSEEVPPTIQARVKAALRAWTAEARG
jgi:RNA polymerase sigma-70 factor (ECF subfamily)